MLLLDIFPLKCEGKYKFIFTFEIGVRGFKKIKMEDTEVTPNEGDEKTAEEAKADIEDEATDEEE